MAPRKLFWYRLFLIIFSVFIFTNPGYSEDIKLEGNRNINCETTDGVRYVAFQELLTVLDLDQQYSDDTGKYTILSSDRKDGVSLSFAIGSRKISINREEIFIPYPPRLQGQSIMLPADFVLPALGALRVVPTGENHCELTEVTFSPFIDFTRLQFIFSSPAEAITSRGDDNEILITFQKTALGKESSDIPVNSNHVQKIVFTENQVNHFTELTGHIITNCDAEVELFSLENGRRTIIDIIERNARQRGDSSIHSGRNFMSTCKVLIDPGHGGTDHGATMASGLVEKDITLQTAQNIATLMSKDGFEVLLSRKADIDLPLLSRLNAINSASPDLVISVHLSIRPPVVKQTADSNRVTINILALRECEDTDKTDEECGVFSPAKDEIKNGIKIARLLEEELNKTGVTKATVHLLQHIIPNNRVLAPSVLVDIEFSSTALPDDVTAITPVIGAALQRGVFTYFSQMAQNQRSLSSITPNLPGNLIENSLTQDPDQTTQATELSGNSIPKEPADSESSMINTPSQLSEGIRGNTLNEPVFNNSRPLINTTPEGIDLEEFLGPDPDSYIERNQ